MNENTTNKLEEMLAHQEQQINDLSDMIIAQGNDMAALKKQIEKLQNKISVMAEDDSGEASSLSSIEQAARDIPPHY